MSLAWNKTSYEQVVKEFESKGLSLVSTEYVNAHSPLKYICNKHRDKGVQSIKLTNMHRHPNTTCPYCMIENGEFVRNIPIDIYKKYTEDNNYQFVKIESKAKSNRIYFVCNEHPWAGVQSAPWDSIRSHKKSCIYCNGTHRDTDYFRHKISKMLPNVVVIGEYTGAKHRVKCTCTHHPDYVWNPYAYNLMTGYGCKKCANEYIGELIANSPQKNEALFYKCHPDGIKLLTVPSRTNEDVTCLCEKCGNKWSAPFSNMVNPFLLTGCPKCKESRGEKAVSTILEKYNISFTPQYRFAQCKDKHELPFDFYLNDYNTVIEYQGEQHYEKERDVFGVKNDYDTISRHDMIKQDFCKLNNIVLITVPYWEFNNLEYFLMNEFEKNKIKIAI